jgi:hypothetical protein
MISKQPNRHWQPSQATIDGMTGILVDGVPNWGLIVGGRLNFPFTWVLMYVPETVNLKTPGVGLVEIDKIDCNAFELAPSSNHLCFTQSGTASLSGGSVSQSGFASVSGSGSVLLPPSGSLLNTFDGVSTMVGVPPIGQALVPGALLTSTTPALIGTQTFTSTPTTSGIVSGATAPAPISTTSSGSLTGLNFSGPNFALSSLSMCVDFTASYRYVSFCLYVAQLNRGTNTWQVRDISNSVIDQGYDYLDHQEYVYFPPVFYGDFNQKKFSLSLPYPIQLGPGEALCASLTYREAIQPLIGFMRLRVRALS